MFQPQIFINPSVPATVRRTVLSAFKGTINLKILHLGEQKEFNKGLKHVQRYIYARR
jgi:hypothetical protein